jgi:hypothetical protein
MARPIKIKINVTRILKEYIFEGKNGKYLNLVAWPNRNGPGQFGDTHFVSQDLPKDARDKGVQAPILGNLTMPNDDAPQPQRQQTTRQPQRGSEPEPTSWKDQSNDDEIPF